MSWSKPKKPQPNRTKKQKRLKVLKEQRLGAQPPRYERKKPYKSGGMK